MYCTQLCLCHGQWQHTYKQIFLIWKLYTVRLNISLNFLNKFVWFTKSSDEHYEESKWKWKLFPCIPKIFQIPLVVYWRLHVHCAWVSNSCHEAYSAEGDLSVIMHSWVAEWTAAMLGFLGRWSQIIYNYWALQKLVLEHLLKMRFALLCGIF